MALFAFVRHAGSFPTFSIDAFFLNFLWFEAKSSKIVDYNCAFPVAGEVRP